LKVSEFTRVYGSVFPLVVTAFTDVLDGPVQTGPGAFPASSTKGTVSFPGQSSRGVALTTHSI